jgi:hypothetical protein
MARKQPKEKPSPVATSPGFPSVEELEDALPDPQILDELADQAAPKISVARYWSTVSKLRAKNYTWREVSTWLSAHGVDLHYKRLERYAKTQQVTNANDPETEDGE